MISVVLYGRNDSYGYNLHKRAAISLNCVAELLTDPGDEIIFVDYNTPDDFPTFPEAIQDTLTQRAKAMLRILRVRPSHHERFRGRTHLACLEPIARNVGIRRSNAGNRWILSTNTDMVFVPRKEASLSEIVAKLPDGYYHLPRFEVPESLWESVDRMDPHGTIEAFSRWGRELHLNEIVYTMHADVKYDGPGDFQLMLRSDLFSIHGFDESMLLGWHLDSNIARRLSLLPRDLGDVVDQLYGYHCDHTRQVTPAHRARSAANDQKVFYENVTAATLPQQADSWGLADVAIEERRAGDNAFVGALYKAVPLPLDAPTTTGYLGGAFNHIDYPAEHVVPFLVDALASYASDAVIAWSGAKRDLLERFARAWRALGFTCPVLVSSEARWLGHEMPEGCVWTAWPDACDRATIFVFDWGKQKDDAPVSVWIFERDPVIASVTRDFRAAVRRERERLSDATQAPRRFVGINAICNAIEGVFNNCVSPALTPLATRIRQGFVSRENDPNVITSLIVGPAGQRLAGGIVSLPGVDGYLFHGPYLDLDEGAYRLSIDFEDVSFEENAAFAAVLEVISNACLIAYREISRDDLRRGTVSLSFQVSSETSNQMPCPRVEFRLRRIGGVEMRVPRIILERTPGLPLESRLPEFDCLPLLTVGPAGKLAPSPVDAQRPAIASREGISDLVAYGPHFWLGSGRYEAAFQLHVERPQENSALVAYVTTHFGRRVLGKKEVDSSAQGLVQRTISFELGEELELPEAGLLEFLLWSEGRVRFSLVAVHVRYVGPGDATNVGTSDDKLEILDLVHIGQAGKGAPGAIWAKRGTGGIVFFGPYLDIEPGNYRVCVTLSQPRSSGLRDPGLSIAAMAEGHIFRVHDVSRQEVERGAIDFVFGVDRKARRLEFVLRSTGHSEIRIASAIFERALTVVKRPKEIELLKSLDTGAAGEWTLTPDLKSPAIRYVASPGVVAHGPYVALDPGAYEVAFDFLQRAKGNKRASIKVDVAADVGKRVLAEGAQRENWRDVFGRALGVEWLPAKAVLTFEVPESTLSGASKLLEFRVWPPSEPLEFFLTRVCLRQVLPAREAARTKVVATS